MFIRLFLILQIVTVLISRKITVVVNIAIYISFCISGPSFTYFDTLCFTWRSVEKGNTTCDGKL